MKNVYSPPIGALFEPIAIAAQNGLAELRDRKQAADRERRSWARSATSKRRLRDRSEHYLLMDAARRLGFRRARDRRAVPRSRGAPCGAGCSCRCCRRCSGSSSSACDGLAGEMTAEGGLDPPAGQVSRGGRPAKADRRADDGVAIGTPR